MNDMTSRLEADGPVGVTTLIKDIDFTFFGAAEPEPPPLSAADEGGKEGKGDDAPIADAPDANDGGKEGKGGALPSFTAFPSIDLANADFMAEVFAEVPEDAESVVTGKPGDPQEGGWPANPTTDIERVCPKGRNNYFNCASFRLGDDGLLTARKEHAAAYHALVLDDVGTKVDRVLLGSIEPMWELETSPGNFQVGFKLSPPLHDPAEVDRFQQRIAKAGLTDKGALGIARWARLPNGINGKPKYEVDGQPFHCRLHAWNPDQTYSAEELLKALVPPEPPKSSSQPAKRKTGTPTIDGEVYQPRAPESPVVTAFKEHGLYKRPIGPGKHDVTCPWLDEHTDGIDTGAAYFEPDGQYPIGGFRCQHSHGDKYRIRQVLDHFDLTGGQARNRPTIRIVAGEMKGIFDAAIEVLAGQGDIYQAGGFIVKASLDTMSGDWRVQPLGEQELLLNLANGCDWERYERDDWRRCDPPQRHIGMIFKAQSYDWLPVLKGLARQPYYREADGQLVSTPGYDTVSHRLGVFPAGKFPAIGDSEAAAQQALADLRELLSEFHFESPVDEAAALSAILTSATRPAYDLAPAFHIKAPASGSGKSYLCDLIGRFAGPGSPSRMSYPKTSEEATKAMMAALLASPAVIEFDDMDTDWLPHGAINRMLTSHTMTDRVLGYSKTATVSTNALVLGSGNNVGPIRDLSRRVMTINLNTRQAVPGTIAYKGDPVGTLRANRERYVAAALTIVEAWKRAGCPKQSLPAIASYGGKWADFCRHPLVWLGQPDPTASLIEQMRSDPDAEQLETLFHEWHKKHGSEPVTIRRLLGGTYDSELNEAIQDLPVVERSGINKSKLGWFFKRNMNRVVGGFMLEKAMCSERNAWRVVRVGGEKPPLPSSPPSAPEPENLF